ncbi:hypothetical protein [endosymbiont GvMRE of Glomus versiforme]|uniref:hypothetical protein n=1 Tax=endosymbiont GvMRE of Glomus versiforme TaxID=2039283 RepID=UPI000EEAF437|nr:hypothetical protein [endosymbiont GvMRE of Glomus versiforme]RHZ37583.1 hypothetical protein GvMRE_I1g509 [endosymbiont GvMRE of Glomus versiforme]
MSKIKSETQCDKCKRIFYRKTRLDKNDGKRKLNQINEVVYWTQGKAWENYHILCRACLNDWFEKYRGAFVELVEPKKKRLFYYYRYLELFDKKKEFYKGKL